MSYTEHDSGAPAVDAQESADEAAAQAQMERDQFTAVKQITGNCTIWNKAKTPQGYGVTTKNNKTVYAHRVAAEEAYGPIPEGMMVCHR